jgi:hypothetical protein
MTDPTIGLAAANSILRDHVAELEAERDRLKARVEVTTCCEMCDEWDDLAGEPPSWVVCWKCYNRQATEAQKRREAIQAERDQFRKDAADAAALRRAFNAAVAAFQEAGKQLKPLREGEPPPAGERALMAPWQKLYEAVRDTQAGLGILAENAAHVGEMAAVLDDYADTFAEDQCGVAESHGIWLDLNYDRVQELEAAAIAALAPDAAQRALARLRALEQAADFLRTIRLARWGDGPAFWEVDEANLRFVLTALDAGK